MLNTIFNHKSIRKYKSDPISDDILNDILKAAIRASNTGNMQIYSVIVTKDNEQKNKLSGMHFNQPMVKQAPVLLTFCADINRFNKWCEARNAEPAYDNFLWLYNATIDATIAAQNAALAAEAHNLGICYLGTTTYMAEGIIDVLKLPKGVVPVTTLVLGYPDEQPELTERLPDEAVVHFETYHDFDNQKIDELYNDFEALDKIQGIVKENELDNLAQVFTQKRYVKKDNLTFSNKFLDIIKKQGFFNNQD